MGMVEEVVVKRARFQLKTKQSRKDTNKDNKIKVICQRQNEKERCWHTTRNGGPSQCEYDGVED